MTTVSNFLYTYPNQKDEENFYLNNGFDKFNDTIFKKKEFNEKKLKKDPESVLNKGDLYNHQIIVSRFISPYTTYDGLLLFQGLGSGKTCSAVAIAEGIKDKRASRRAYVLTRGTGLQKNFIDQLVHVCTDGRYIPPNYKKLTDKEKYIRSKKLYSDFYSFETYVRFAKQIKELRKSNNFVEIANRMFGECLFIIDEAHNIRTKEKLKDEMIDVYDNLFALFQVLKNKRVVLLTGTPMKDVPDEIGGLMNLLLPKENLLPTGKAFREQFVKSDGSIKNSEVISKSILGRVSYLRTVLTDVNKKFIGEKNVGELKHFIVYPNKMSEFQTNIYNNALNADASEEGPSGIFINTRQAALCVGPDGSWGKDIDNKGLLKLLNAEKNKSDKLEVLKKYSKKYADVVQKIIEKPDELSFAYISLVSGSGAILFGKILSSFGYAKGNGKETTKGRRYVIITNETTSSGGAENIIKGFNNPKNMKGDYIQVIIGSRVIGEGFSLKNVRQCHVLTPFWNYTEVDQSIARTLRLNSHKDLINAGINPTVRIFQHVAVPNYSNIQVIDKVFEGTEDLDEDKIEELESDLEDDMFAEIEDALQLSEIESDEDDGGDGDAPAFKPVRDTRPVIDDDMFGEIEDALNDDDDDDDDDDLFGEIEDALNDDDDDDDEEDDFELMRKAMEQAQNKPEISQKSPIYSYSLDSDVEVDDDDDDDTPNYKPIGDDVVRPQRDIYSYSLDSDVEVDDDTPNYNPIDNDVINSKRDIYSYSLDSDVEFDNDDDTPNYNPIDNDFGFSSLPEEVDEEFQVVEGTLLKKSFNSIDLYMYTVSEVKDVAIKGVERILKQSAFDCALNYDRNYNKNDVKGSRECDYQKCEYTCTGISPTDMANPIKAPTLNSYQNLYEKEYMNKVVEDIKKLFRTRWNNHIMGVLSDLKSKYSDFQIYQGIVNIISNNLPIKNMNGTISYLRYTGNTLFLVDNIRTNKPYMENQYAKNTILDKSTTLKRFLEIYKAEKTSRILKKIPDTSDNNERWVLIKQMDKAYVQKLIEASVNKRGGSEMNKWIRSIFDPFIFKGKDGKYFTTFTFNSKCRGEGNVFDDCEEKEQNELNILIANRFNKIIPYYGIINETTNEFLIRDVSNPAVLNRVKGRVCGTWKPKDLIERIILPANIKPQSFGNLNSMGTQEMIDDIMGDKKTSKIFTKSELSKMNEDDLRITTYWIKKSRPQICSILAEWFIKNNKFQRTF